MTVLNSKFKIKPLSELIPEKTINDPEKKKHKFEIVWFNVAVLSILHIFTVYAIYLTVVESRYKMLAFNYLISAIIGLGSTAGSHRLWSHRSYKVKPPLKIILFILQTAGFQNSIFTWAKDHRLHHKYTDTDADPHNAKQGVFFSHVGWLLCRSHPDVIEKAQTIDVSDLTSDKLIMWQHRNYLTLMPLFTFVIPSLIVQKVFAETLLNSFLFGGIMRYTISVHYTWLINSAAHIWGMRPYDKNIGPVQNTTVSILTNGEGFHNYHHVFPWDYKAAELGNYSLNLTLAFINLCAKIGWAYDMKTVSPSIIERRIRRTGDGSWEGHFSYDKFDKVEGNNKDFDSHNHMWGWGDRDMDPVEIKMAEIRHREGR